mmetsp:Transcript_5191/g.17339  ORF Transcript_5191/g.17339 Transcript_5191/m.17339 type:complete len:254 (-) Transcript_5191:1094-1855(-)
MAVVSTRAVVSPATGGDGNAPSCGIVWPGFDSGPSGFSVTSTLSSKFPSSRFTGVVAALDTFDDDGSNSIFSSVGGAVEAAASGSSEELPSVFVGVVSGEWLGAILRTSAPPVPSLVDTATPMMASPSFGTPIGGGAHAFKSRSTAPPPSFTPNRPSPDTSPTRVFDSRWVCAIRTCCCSSFRNPARLKIAGRYFSLPLSMNFFITFRNCESCSARTSRSSCTSAIWSSNLRSFASALSSKYCSCSACRFPAT